RLILCRVPHSTPVTPWRRASAGNDATTLPNRRRSSRPDLQSPPGEPNPGTEQQNKQTLGRLCDALRSPGEPGGPAPSLLWCRPEDGPKLSAHHGHWLRRDARAISSIPVQAWGEVRVLSFYEFPPKAPFSFSANAETWRGAECTGPE